MKKIILIIIAAILITLIGYAIFKFMAQPEQPRLPSEILEAPGGETSNIAL